MGRFCLPLTAQDSSAAAGRGIEGLSPDFQFGIALKKLALTLCECYLEPMLSPQEDAYGQCMYEHFRGHRLAEVMERDDGYVQANENLPAAYFA